jgi:hypothetical protein
MDNQYGSYLCETILLTGRSIVYYYNVYDYDYDYDDKLLLFAFKIGRAREIEIKCPKITF